MAFMAAAAPYLMAAGGIAQAGMGIIGGIQQKKAMEYNARAMETEARYRMAAGEIEAKDHRRMIRSLLSTQQTQFAGSGLAGKNALLVMENTAAQGELDAQRILDNAQKDADRMKTKAIQDRWKGKQAETAGWIKGGTSLLKTGANVGMMMG